MLGYLFEGLTETSWLTDEVEPALAESWGRSADGLTWTFRLRTDIKWHDGQPFTAHDVDFTFNRIIYNHDIPASSRPSFHFRVFDEETGRWEESPMTVTALDNYTVECVLRRRSPRSSGRWAPPYIRSTSSEQHVTTALRLHVGYRHEPGGGDRHGPLHHRKLCAGRAVVMRRNPSYWLKDDAGNRLPYLDRVVHVIVPDLEEELARFRARESDYHGVLGEELAELEPLQKEGNFTIYRRGPAFGTTFLGFNMNPGKNPDTGEPYLAPEKLKWFQNKQVPAGRRARHRQGDDHRRRAARRRLPAVVVHQPGRGRLPQTRTSESTTTTWTGRTISWTASAGSTRTGTGYGKTARATRSSSRV